ncbi:MAG TPA: NUDIX domain-containing protein [Candidatus Paceibacterota bacterium]
MQPCDHSSVGVLVYRDGRLLLIDRKRPPFGLAAPAGHVDDHGDSGDTEEERYKKAAIAELGEETGLTTLSLELVTEGRRDNPCRRGSTWHYWRIYRAKTSGELNLSEEETQGHLWCNEQQMKELLAGKPILIDEKEASLEPVWREWFSELPGKMA